MLVRVIEMLQATIVAGVRVLAMPRMIRLAMRDSDGDAGEPSAARDEHTVCRGSCYMSASGAAREVGGAGPERSRTMRIGSGVVAPGLPSTATWRIPTAITCCISALGVEEKTAEERGGRRARGALDLRDLDEAARSRRIVHCRFDHPHRRPDGREVSRHRRVCERQRLAVLRDCNLRCAWHGG